MTTTVPALRREKERLQNQLTAANAKLAEHQGRLTILQAERTVGWPADRLAAIASDIAQTTANITFFQDDVDLLIERLAAL